MQNTHIDSRSMYARMQYARALFWCLGACVKGYISFCFKIGQVGVWYAWIEEKQANILYSMRFSRYDVQTVIIYIEVFFRKNK